MSFFNSCYKKENLDSIINAAVEQLVPNLGMPEKIVSVYFDTGETEDGATDFNDTYHELINQTRFYEKEEKVVFVDESYIYIIPFSKIVDYAIVLPNEDNKSIYSTTTQITKSDTGDVIKRAIIGGVIAGGVGAIIGGATAKSETKENKFESYFQAMANKPLLELHIKFDNIITPVIKINFDTDKEKIQEVAETLNVIVKRNTENFNANKNEAINDEIIKEKYTIEDIGIQLGIYPVDPYSKYNDDASEDGWDSDTICGWLFIIAIVIGLIYLFC